MFHVLVHFALGFHFVRHIHWREVEGKDKSPKVSEMGELIEEGKKPFSSSTKIIGSRWIWARNR